MWEHLFLMVAEVAQVRRTIHEMSWRQYVDFHDKPLLVRYLLDPRPTVLVTGHYGNFEVAGYVLGMFGFPSFTIARKLDNPYIDRFLNQFRGSTGQFILPKQGCAPQVEAVLQMGGTLVVAGRPACGGQGLLGRVSRPACLVSQGGGLVHVDFGGTAGRIVSCDGPGARCTSKSASSGIADPQTWDSSLAAVKPLTRWYNERLEEMILVAPEQYWWVHRRWKGQPPARRGKAAAPSPDSKAA